MADQKISALVSGSPVTAPTGAIGFGVAQAGASKGLTLAQVMTFVNTAPIWAAGTATAGTWPEMTAGTLLTTPVSGTIEFDGALWYTTTAAGRGVSPSTYFMKNTAALTGVTGTSLQPMFHTSTNGALTLPVGVYEFECLLELSNLSATSGTVSFGFGGTASISALDSKYQALATKAATPGAATFLLSSTFGMNAITPATTGTTCQAWIKGVFHVATAGTIIPSFSVGVSTTPSVGFSSFFKCTPMPAGLQVGPWS